MFGLAHFNDLLTASRALNEPQPAPSKSAFQQELWKHLDQKQSE